MKNALLGGRGAWSALLVAGGLVLAPQPVLAQECESDSDCADGLVCEVVGGTDCAAVACAPGTECPEPEPCESEDITACVPGPCESDSDCGDGMVCYTETYEECSGGAASAPCADGASECPEPEVTEPECTETTVSQCAPAWVLPCSADADCGEGFSCVEQQSCWCSGSAGSAGGTNPDGSEPAPEPMPPEEMCGCEPSGEFYCEPERTTCDDASDCLDGWSCEADPDSAVCGGAEPPPDGASGDGEAGGGDLCNSEPEQICLPPYFDAVYQGGSLGGYGEAEGRSASGTGGDDDGTAADPQPPSDEDGEAASGGSGDDGGCQMGAGPAGTGGPLAALALGLGALALGRRRRRA